MKKMVKRIASLAMAALLSVTMLAGCGNSSATTNTTVTDPAITLDGASISMEEARFYAYSTKLQYEAYYGPDIWDIEIEEGKTYGDELKMMVEKALAEMLFLNLKAKDYDVKLSEEDEALIVDYIENFKTSLGEELMAEEGITEEAVRSTLEKMLISTYVYEAMAAAEEVELTDAEKADATCVRVQHILITTNATTKVDAEGKNVDMTEDELEAYKADQKALAETVLEKAQNGEDFQALADEYTSENAGFEFAFDKTGFDPVNYSYMVEPFYKASWELAEGEISGLVESDYGYHIIKCVSVNDEAATQAMISILENNLKTTNFEAKFAQLIEEANEKVSDAWKAYKIVSPVVEETAVTETEKK